MSRLLVKTFCFDFEYGGTDKVRNKTDVSLLKYVRTDVFLYCTEYMFSVIHFVLLSYHLYKLYSSSSGVAMISPVSFLSINNILFNDKKNKLLMLVVVRFIGMPYACTP